MLSEKINNVFSTTSKTKLKVPSIEITLTTYNDNENGDIWEATPGVVKIDGEEDSVKDDASKIPIFQSPIVRSLLIISAGQFLHFMAFDSLMNIQSTINSADGIGTTSIATIYGIFILSSMFLSSMIIKYLGSKKTLVLAMICFLPFVIANFYPALYTLIPSAVLCGLASGPLWIAKCVYLNRNSHSYAKIHKISAEIMNAWFFSVYTAIHQNTEIWGNLLSYYLLKTQHEHEPFLSRTDLDSCGSHFCDSDLPNFSASPLPPALDKRYILMAIFTILAIMAVFFVAFFLDPVESETENVSEEEKFTSKNILVTFHQLSKPDQILLLPLSLYTGIVNGFYSGDYTKAYVACALGIPHVGSISICYGVVSTLMASAGGPCIMILGRAGLFLLASIAHILMLVALTLWTPHPDNTSGFYLIATAHGIGNGVWMSQVLALYGVLFQDDEEAAYSCHYFLYSLGFLASFSFSGYICNSIKLYIPLTILVINLLCYLALEIRMVKKTIVTASNLKRR